MSKSWGCWGNWRGGEFEELKSRCITIRRRNVSDELLFSLRSLKYIALFGSDSESPNLCSGPSCSSSRNIRETIHFCLLQSALWSTGNGWNFVTGPEYTIGEEPKTTSWSFWSEGNLTAGWFVSYRALWQKDTSVRITTRMSVAGLSKARGEGWIFALVPYRRFRVSASSNTELGGLREEKEGFTKWEVVAELVKDWVLMWGLCCCWLSFFRELPARNFVSIAWRC